MIRHGEGALFEAEGGEFDAWLPAEAVVTRRVVLHQMLCPAPAASRRLTEFEILSLSDDDADEMGTLAEITQPGPYRERTHALGRFLGIREAGLLVAMAGQRLRTDGFIEICAVCTRPEHRGRGLAAALIRQQVQHILADGAFPFLHAAETNLGALRLYESLGFVARRRIGYTVFQPRKTTAPWPAGGTAPVVSAPGAERANAGPLLHPFHLTRGDEDDAGGARLESCEKKDCQLQRPVRPL